jgi:hypothetical protein
MPPTASGCRTSNSSPGSGAEISISPPSGAPSHASRATFSRTSALPLISTRGTSTAAIRSPGEPVPDAACGPSRSPAWGWRRTPAARDPVMMPSPPSCFSPSTWPSSCATTVSRSTCPRTRPAAKRASAAGDGSRNRGSPAAVTLIQAARGRGQPQVRGRQVREVVDTPVQRRLLGRIQAQGLPLRLRLPHHRRQLRGGQRGDLGRGGSRHPRLLPRGEGRLQPARAAGPRRPAPLCAGPGAGLTHRGRQREAKIRLYWMVPPYGSTCRVAFVGLGVGVGLPAVKPARPTGLSQPLSDAQALQNGPQPALNRRILPERS